uniref:Uncharacterized protein n=1 Tax=Timema bartmani TaxID=61472 RepID=A0A7R9F0N7_9NEOP|nr:unnamed protein product [Timema bartmani]
MTLLPKPSTTLPALQCLLDCVLRDFGIMTDNGINTGNLVKLAMNTQGGKESINVSEIVQALSSCVNIAQLPKCLGEDFLAADSEVPGSILGSSRFFCETVDLERALTQPHETKLRTT